MQDRARLSKIIVLHDLARLSIQVRARSSKFEQDRARSSKIKQDLTRLNFLCYFFTLLSNKQLKESKNLIKVTSDDIFISSKTKTPVQYDGEFLGYLPAQIKNEKKTINLLVKEELNVQTDQ